MKKPTYALLGAVLIFAAGSVTYLRSSEGRDDRPIVGRPFVITFSHYRRSKPTEGQGERIENLISLKRQDLNKSTNII